MKNKLKALAVSIGLVFSTASGADTLHIVDGSRIEGQVLSFSADKIKMQTAFAGEVLIDRSKVEGIDTSSRRKIVLSSGDSVMGILDYQAADGQSITGTMFGDVPLKEGIRVVALDEDPDAGMTTKAQQALVTAERERTAKLKAREKDYQQRIAQLEEKQAEFADPWSGEISLGISGADGNTDRLGIQGRGELLRESDADRLKLYVQGDLQRENGNTTANEVLAGASIERDISKRWFTFGKADFEKDDFENLDLRGVASVGIGYFLVRKTEFDWKGLLGLGYQHETFSDGSSSDEGVVSLGYEMRYTHSDWIKILHDLTYYPSLTSPASDYRLVSSTMGEMPIGSDTNWKLRIGFRNQYDAQPRPGIKKLDTTYLFNMIYDWD